MFVLNQETFTNQQLLKLESDAFSVVLNFSVCYVGRNALSANRTIPVGVPARRDDGLNNTSFF